MLLACYLLARAVTGHASVPFPAGYRHWVYVHSLLVGPSDASFGKRPCEKPCTGGIFHFYANEKAMEGYRSGKFPDGSVLADELLELRGQANGVATEGPRHGVGVMVKDGLKYGATGGWGFESFAGDDETHGILTAGERAKCFQCHQSRRDHDFVFTEFHDR